MKSNITFDPKTDKYPYPEDTDKHYLVVKKNNGLVFDSNYPYIDESKSFKFKKALVRFMLLILVFPLTYIRLGLRIKGKENLKKHKEEIKKGVISSCNHIHMWDYLSIMNAIKPVKPYILSWAPNIRGENGTLIRMVGGIPIPENDPRATITYFKTVEKLLNSGGWLHIYSEGSMWEYYGKIRPFKRGAAYFAVKHNNPIIPLAFSFRKPGWIRRVIFKQTALLTLNIGEPLYKDDSITNIKEQERELTIRLHDETCRLAGIDPKDNLYEPIYNNSKRIDYYTNIYGVKYKGSW